MTATGRQCGDCTLCCKVMAIEQLAKPANAWCPHCRPASGCQIYPSRPAECRAFSCVWLVNELLEERWKPSRSKLVLTTSDDGLEVRCDPGFPDAWRRQPFRNELREWAIAGEPLDMTVVVIVGQRITLLTAEREFDLGVVGPDERVVRELDGTRVVNVTVAKASDLVP